MGKEKKNFCISLAGHTIEVESQYSEVYNLCKEYKSNLFPEIRIIITDDDLALERSDTIAEGYKPGDGYLETLAVYRKICEALLEYDVILMHGAVIAHDNSAYMFTAPS